MAGDYFSNDTIAAIATSLAGDGGIGVIRLSGPRALECAQRLSRNFENPEPRYLHRIEIADPETGKTMDDGLAAYFPEGHSYTGEESVELQLHGGRFLLQSALNAAIRTGHCRLALPGEFSFRAVRNGKFTLSAAQSVQQLIGARSRFEVEAARANFAKKRVEYIDGLAARIRSLLARTELAIDFSDQDVEVVSEQGAKSEVAELLRDTEALLARLEAAQRIARGIQITIAGRPNAGKSTLFNAILSEERAIVSAEAGTTRDVITEDFALGRYRVRLADTAGIRDAGGTIEREGVARARKLLAGSDLVVLLLDANLSYEELVREIYEDRALRAKTVVALNKSDLAPAAAARIRARLRLEKNIEAIAISALSHDGIGSLLETLRKTLDRGFGLGADAFLPTEFQLQMLIFCRDSLADAEALLARGGHSNPELLSASLRSAARALSDLCGDTTPDAVLAKIFSEFCIGK
ncbi:MAG: tRNA uridine-5-carboxymethylaminomethyl(34) synthesis GTPase MnmE [Deltaproteobacteria bacterium]|nr:tRNA uridine-5-carboxymethylaminomethyl(34) synthesis GTPase MnmE [Deltaproteobacteria bacterium]